MGNLRHLGLIRAHHSFIDPMASFEEIMRHMPQLDTQDRERDNPHRTGSENPWPKPITLTLYPETSFCSYAQPISILRVRRTRAG